MSYHSSAGAATTSFGSWLRSFPIPEGMAWRGHEASEAIIVDEPRYGQLVLLAKLSVLLVYGCGAVVGCLGE